MPPKRKAAAAKKGAGGKKAKKAAAAEVEVDEAGPSTARDAMAKLKTAGPGKKKVYKVDALCRLANSAQVVDDFDCMLNQTNIGHNNNKYYIIQVLHQFGSYYAWNRWGRVGEPGQNSMKGPTTKDQAVADFKKKFKDKTRNNWDARADFKFSPGKYTLIEMDADDEDDDMEEKMAKLDEIDGVQKVTAECTLDKPTQTLIKLIFDNDMFKEAMANMEIDVKKMPLGKLSKSQIAKGFEVLEEIEDAIKKNKKAGLMDMTSRFYTLIPHDFGRQRPPVIGDAEVVRKKMDMLLVLADIEAAQAMQEEDKKKKKKGKELDTKEVPHPIDQNYNLLNCGLTTVGKKSQEYKVIENYLKATEGGWRKLNILDVWEVDRDGEDSRFTPHNKIDNRKLLWHGTNVAVVAAILKGGLRIMPHSGGRVGRGIYFASENGKSAGYVRPTAGGIGIMFLNEVVLGKEKHITMGDSSLVAPPSGYDSIVAKGRTEPDPSKDKTLTLDGKKVVVPQGKPIQQPKFNNSSFSQSEYLIYKESQNRLRYMLKIKFG